MNPCLPRFIWDRVGVNVSKVYTQKKNGNFASNYGCSKMSSISLFKCPFLTQNWNMREWQRLSSNQNYGGIYNSNPIFRVLLWPQKDTNHIRNLIIIDKYFHVLLYYQYLDQHLNLWHTIKNFWTTFSKNQLFRKNRNDTRCLSKKIRRAWCN